MKKIVALLMTAVMTIGMATAAFAAPSPQPTTGTIVGGKNASGQDVDLSKVKTSDNYSTNDAPGVEKIKANPQSVLKDAVGAANANGYGLAYVTSLIMIFLLISSLIPGIRVRYRCLEDWKFSPL